MDVSVIVPTFNEAANVPELIARIDAAVTGLEAEIIFVDDSTDNTPQVIAGVDSRTAVRVIHRLDPVGGLSGAVVAGIRESLGDWVIVMDGDLQHPPEMIPCSSLQARAIVQTSLSLHDIFTVVRRRDSTAGLAPSARQGQRCSPERCFRSSCDTALTR